jgi:hypothetical protein
MDEQAQLPSDQQMRSDVRDLVILTVVFVAVDVWGVSAARSRTSPSNNDLLVRWATILAIACIAIGIVQALCRRPWHRTLATAVLAAFVLAFIVYVSANSDPGSADCPGQGPCDTGFGIGALFIVLGTGPCFMALLSLGRAPVDLIRRLG